jgi:hypothetical protein
MEPFLQFWKQTRSEPPLANSVLFNKERIWTPFINLHVPCIKFLFLFLHNTVTQNTSTVEMFQFGLIYSPNLIIYSMFLKIQWVLTGFQQEFFLSLKNNAKLIGIYNVKYTQNYGEPDFQHLSNVLLRTCLQPTVNNRLPRTTADSYCID